MARSVKPLCFLFGRLRRCADTHEDGAGPNTLMIDRWFRADDTVARCLYESTVREGRERTTAPITPPKRHAEMRRSNPWVRQ